MASCPLNWEVFLRFRNTSRDKQQTSKELGNDSQSVSPLKEKVRGVDVDPFFPVSRLNQ